MKSKLRGCTIPPTVVCCAVLLWCCGAVQWWCFRALLWWCDGVVLDDVVVVGCCGAPLSLLVSPVALLFFLFRQLPALE
jgi:hypothetical protein